jgi:hypothetical protein
VRRLTRRAARLAVSQPAVVTLLAFGFVGLWATAGILKARASRPLAPQRHTHAQLTRLRRPLHAPLPQGIEALPLVPTLFELIGIAFSAWFVYRYLLFKPDRCARETRARRWAAHALVVGFHTTGGASAAARPLTRHPARAATS